jgi:hypothetical protein
MKIIIFGGNFSFHKYFRKYLVLSCMKSVYTNFIENIPDVEKHHENLSGLSDSELPLISQLSAALLPIYPIFSGEFDKTYATIKFLYRAIL